MKLAKPGTELPPEMELVEWLSEHHRYDQNHTLENRNCDSNEDDPLVYLCSSNNHLQSMLQAPQLFFGGHLIRQRFRSLRVHF